MRHLLLLVILVACSNKHNITGPPDNPPKCKHHHEHNHNHNHDDDKNKMEKQR